MNLLLDSHILLWSIDEPNKLTKKEYEALNSLDNLKFISAASVWELQVKSTLGKLKLPENFKEFLENKAFSKLSVDFSHAHAAGKLPLLHKDPFDRMLISQALLEDFTIITRDPIFQRYGVKVLEA